MLLSTGSKRCLLLLIFFCILNNELGVHTASSGNRSVNINDSLVGIGIILDMESWIGKSIRSCITLAISDFYALNHSYRTRLVLHTRNSKGDPLKALSAVHHLLKKVKVQAIIGPETYLQAKLLASYADEAKVPIFSFVGKPSMEYPYLFQIKDDEFDMAKSIAALVEAYKWRDVIFVHEETDHGPEILQYLVESFQDKNIRISRISAISASATHDQMIKELHKHMSVLTTVIIVHTSPSLASSLFLNAKRLGMMSKEYAWILTEKTMDVLRDTRFEVIESLQGAIGLRSYIPVSRRLHNLTARWHKQFYSKYFTLASREMPVLAIRAYDAIWALAESVERVAGVLPQNGPMLLDEILKIRFKGISGEFRLSEGKLISNGFTIINAIDYGERRVGYWTSSKGIRRAQLPLNNAGIKAIIWPGGSTTTPKDWKLQTTPGKKLKIGVRTGLTFKNFIDAVYDAEKNVTTATGFSVDVFNTCIRALPYDVPYEFIPFDKGSYDYLIQKVYTQEIDMVLGDSTILANRSEFVDFTATYTDMGIGTLARVKKKDMWIFLKPLDVDLWITIAAFVILTGFVVWAIESMDQESERSPSQQIGRIIWLILLTIFFAQREKLSSNLSRFVMFIWLLVVLILITSYTATLASMLTVEQFQLASKGGIVGFHGGSFFGGVTISNLNFTDSRQKPYYSYEAYANALSIGGKRGGADAIVDEVPYIKMFLGRHSSDYAMVSSQPITSGFAFIFRKGSPLVKDMSREISRIREDGTLGNLEKKWYENQIFVLPQDSSVEPKTLNLDWFGGLFIVSGISSALALMISVVYLLRAKIEIQRILSLVVGRNLMATIRYLLHRNVIRT